MFIVFNNSISASSDGANNGRLTDLEMRDSAAVRLLGRVETSAGSSLCKLRLWRCWNLADITISQLATKFDQLACLDLTKCRNLTDATLRHITGGFPRSISHQVFSMNVRVNASLLNSLN